MIRCVKLEVKVAIFAVLMQCQLHALIVRTPGKGVPNPLWVSDWMDSREKKNIFLARIELQSLSYYSH